MMSSSHGYSCMGVYVYQVKIGTPAWTPTHVTHSELADGGFDINDDADVTIYSPVNMPLYNDAWLGSDRNQALTYGDEVDRFRSCTSRLEERFLFLSAWWDHLYLDTNGVFAYQDGINDDGSIQTVSKYMYKSMTTSVDRV
jgi:hypothetical protein